MKCSFIGMYRLVHDINNRLSVTKFKNVTVNTEFFKDLEKVFEEVADVVSYCPLFDTTNKDDEPKFTYMGVARNDFFRNVHTDSRY